jgi:hypothetical protein
MTWRGWRQRQPKVIHHGQSLRIEGGSASFLSARVHTDLRQPRHQHLIDME